MAELTPMKKQYNAIKEDFPDCLLFFRLGDFYEMFDDDARTASKELDLALTTRDRGKPAEEQTPMCGVPFHSSEAYIARLIAKGYKVAICEQLEDPAAAQGIVERGVIRVITPGTVTESSMLEEGRSNYLCALWLDGGASAAAFCDVSTGEFCAAAFSSDGTAHLLNELGRFAPKEAVLSAGALKDPELTAFLRKLDILPEDGAARFDPAACEDLVWERFHERVGPAETLAAGALLGYIVETQKFDISHIRALDRFGDGRYMELDYTTRRNLELTENLRTGEKRGSLLWVLDRTKTPMGGRLLRSWVERPLLNPAAIRRRLGAVNELVQAPVARAELIRTLHDIGDIQRLIGRCVYGTANGRDLIALANYFALLPRLRDLTAPMESALLKNAAGMDELADLQADIASLIAEEPPFSVREGGILRDGADPEIDRLRSIRDNGSQMVLDLEARERERTGIKKLKVGYNKVFGYYIDVPRSAGDAPLPDEYIRKQTLVSNERYFTPELKDLENTLLGAKDRIADLEYQIFAALRDRVAAQVERVQAAAAAVAELDALTSLAEVAFRNHYVMPEIDLSRALDIRDGRHPVVEIAQKDTLFVPNDAFLNDSTDRVAIITGPNMAGKSTYMRQTALIVLMAQIGSFVPAKSAVIGITDRVFTRGNGGDGEHPAPRHRRLPPHPGRDRPWHLHLRRHGHRPGDAGVLRGQAPPGRADHVRHALSRALRPGGAHRRRQKLQYHRQKAGREPHLPAEDRPRQRGRQLRNRGREARGRAGGRHQKGQGLSRRAGIRPDRDHRARRARGGPGEPARHGGLGPRRGAYRPRPQHDHPAGGAEPAV